MDVDGGIAADAQFSDARILHKKKKK